MLPSAAEIIARRRRLSAEYEAKKQQAIVKTDDTSRLAVKPPSVRTSDSPSVPHHGQEFHQSDYPARTAIMLESTSGDGSTSESVDKLYSGIGRPENSSNSPRIEMKLPSVDDIVARRRKPSYTYDSQPGATSIAAEKTQEATPELVRALEAAGCCPTPRSSGPRRRSLDTLSLPDDLDLDQLLSNISDEDKDFPLVDLPDPGKGSLPLQVESFINAQFQKDQELPTPELVRALEAAGYCPTPTSPYQRRQSLDKCTLRDEVDLDQMLSNISDTDPDLPSLSRVAAGEKSLPIYLESQISDRFQKHKIFPTPAQQVRALVAAESSLLQKSLSEPYNSQEIKGISASREAPESAQRPSSKVSVTSQATGQKTETGPSTAGRPASNRKSEHPERDKNFLSILPPRDCSNVGLQKQERCIGPGLGRHMILVPPPRRRVDLSELYVNEVVLVKRDRNVWVFAQVKVLTCRGIKAWVPTVQLMVNVPIEIMYTHLRKVEYDEDLKDLPTFPSLVGLKEEDSDQQERIPLPATFDRGKTLRTRSSPKLPNKHKQLHLVRPAHLTHRTLHQPLESTLSCAICLQLLSTVDAHKPWDCDHSCHLFCYQLLVQGTRLNTCNMCSAKKIWDWKTMSCQCGFTGFVQKRMDDLEPPPVCPSCCKLSVTLNPYQPPASSGKEPALPPSVPPTSSSSGLGALKASSFQGSGTDPGEWTPLPKLSRRAVGLDHLEWRHVNCECGLRATVRATQDLRIPPICPACLNPVEDWTIPREDYLLKALLGYTPPDSPTGSSPRPSTSSSLSVASVPNSKADDTTGSESSLLDGFKPPEVSPSMSLPRVITPSSMQTILSPALSERRENSNYMSCQSLPQNNSPPSSSPSKEPQRNRPYSMLSSVPPPPNEQRGTDSAVGSKTGPEHSRKGILHSPIGPRTGKPPKSPSPSPKPAPPISDSTKFRQLPTDSLTFRVTPAQIRQQMKEQTKKRTSQILENKLLQPEQMQSTTRKELLEESIQDSSAATYQSQTSVPKKPPPDLPKKSSSTDTVSMWMTPELINQMLREEEMRLQMQHTTTVNNQPSTSVPKQPPQSMPKKSTDSVSMWMTPELIKQMVLEEELRQQGHDPTESDKQTASVQGNTQPKQVPKLLPKNSSLTDSVPMWMTPEVIMRMATEVEHRQQGQDPTPTKSTPVPTRPKLALPPVQNRNLPTDSLSMWMTPAKIQKMARDEEIRMQQENQFERPPKPTRRDLPTDSVNLWMTPSKIQQMVMMEEEIRRQKQVSSVILGEELQKSVSTIEEESEVSDGDGPTAVFQRPDSLSNVQIGSPSDSKAYSMIPDKLKKMQELQAHQVSHFNNPRQLPTGSAPVPPPPNLAPPSIQIRDLPTDSVSLWMTPGKVKRMIREEEIRQQQEKQSEPPPKPTRRDLPTDSVNLWMTPSKIQKMAMMEDEIRREKQVSLVTMGEELRKPISTIEEDIEVFDGEQPKTIQGTDSHSNVQRGGSSSTDSEAHWRTPDKLKKMRELQAQQIVHFNPGSARVPSGSEAASEQHILDETDDNNHYVSSSQPQQQKPIQTFKKLPLKLQHIPEDDQVTQKRSPDSETKSSQSSAASSSSPSPQQHEEAFEPTSLGNRLEKLKTKKYKSSAPPAIPNQPDGTVEIAESDWIPIVRDGQGSTSAHLRELERKAKEVESEHGIQ